MITATSTVLLLGPQLEAINKSLQIIALALQNKSFWNTQLFAAIIGATLGLIPSFYLLYKDRPRIKVKVAHVLVPSTASQQVLDGISITIYNFGRRPITVERAFLTFQDGESLLFMSESNFIGGRSGLPKVLGEGNSHYVAILAGEMGDAFRRKQCYPIVACYGDALGRVYKIKTSKKFWDSVFRVGL